MKSFKYIVICRVATSSVKSGFVHLPAESMAARRTFTFATLFKVFTEKCRYTVRRPPGGRGTASAVEGACVKVNQDRIYYIVLSFS